MDTMGARIKSARQKAGLSQEDLARALNATKSAISKYEKGLRQPRIEQLEAIAATLGVSVAYILGYETEKVVIPGRLKIVSVEDPESENIIYRILATDEEAFSIGCQIIESSGISIAEFSIPGRISAALEKLNDIGQYIALERIEELTKIPDYQRIAQPPDTQQEPPEEGPEGPQSGPPLG